MRYNEYIYISPVEIQGEDRHEMPERLPATLVQFNPHKKQTKSSNGSLTNKLKKLFSYYLFETSRSGGSANDTTARRLGGCSAIAVCEDVCVGGGHLFSLADASLDMACSRSWPKTTPI